MSQLPGDDKPYELVVPGPVARVISEELPERVAWAVIDFINGPLLENPWRVGAHCAASSQAVTLRI